MRTIFFLAIMLGLSSFAAAQSLPFFINAITDGVDLNVDVDFAATAVYGDQFAVAYDITDPETATNRPVVFLYNEDGTLSSTNVIEEGAGADLALGTSSPDGTKVWFAGGIRVTDDSDNSRDIALVYGDENGLSFVKIGIGRNDYLRGLTATNDGAYALIDVQSSPNRGPNDSLVVARINNDLTLGESVKFTLPLRFRIDNFIFNSIANAALITYRIDGETFVNRIDLSSGMLEEITLPALSAMCSFPGDETIIGRTGISSSLTDKFYLLTSCANIVEISGINASLITMMDDTGFGSLSAFSTALIISEETPDNFRALILGSSFYQTINLSSASPFVSEPNFYGNNISLNASSITRMAGGKYLNVDNPGNGQFSIVDEGVPDSWTEMEATSLPLPEDVSTRSRAWKIAKFGDDIIGTTETGAFADREIRIQFFSEDGVPQESFGQDEESFSEAVLLANGNFAVSTVRESEITNGDIISIIEFNRSEGIVGEIASVEVRSTNFTNLVRQLLQTSTGDLVIGYQFRDETFASFYTVRKYAQSGAEIFSTTLPDTILDIAEFAPLSIDVNDNVYLAFPKADDQPGLDIVSLDGAGNLRYISDVDSPLTFSLRFEMVAHPNGNMQVFGIGTDAERQFRAVSIEIDPASGEKVSETIIFPDLYSYALRGNYIPGTDTLALYHAYFAGPSSNAAEELRDRVLFLDANLDVVYEQELNASQLEAVFVVDAFVSEDRNLYAIGQQFIPELNTSVTTLVGVDFSNLTQVVSVADEFAITANLRLFPNPTTDRISLNWNSTAAGHYQVEILDQLGRRLSRQSGDHPSGPVSVSVGLAHLPAGIYYARLITGEGQSTQPIMRK